MTIYAKGLRFGPLDLAMRLLNSAGNVLHNRTEIVGWDGQTTPSRDQANPEKRLKLPRSD